MAQHIVASEEDLPVGSCKIVCVGRKEIGIFNIAGELRAFENTCPHHGAPVCQGPVGGTNLPSEPDEFNWDREGEILRCPWHGWEFDLNNGRALADPNFRCRMYEVTVEGDNIIVNL